MVDALHTPGPWRWEVNRKHKTVKLCGGPPKRGFGRYDLTVLSFSRYGMAGAAPVFWNWNMERWVGKPERADALAIEVEGREHHFDWFADVNHPDARLIAAAPELLEAAHFALELIETGTIYEQQCCDGGGDCGCRGATYADEAEHFLRAAIAKATATHSTGEA